MNILLFLFASGTIRKDNSPKGILMSEKALCPQCGKETIEAVIPKESQMFVPTGIGKLPVGILAIATFRCSQCDASPDKPEVTEA